MIGTILIIDDEVSLARSLEKLLSREDYQVAVAHSAGEARPVMREFCPDFVLMDIGLPDADGAELMVEFRRDYPDTQFIIITAHGSIRSAVLTTRSGAVDYLTKPFEPAELLLSLRNNLNKAALREEVRHHRARCRITRSSHGKHGTPAASPAMRDALAMASQAVRHNSIVLLTGESGTGKDHVARWIHAHSLRAAGPFFGVNCAALSRELAEAELFGHEPGAFTGSRGRKRGLLELADRGTILLNEIAEMDLALQSKLLTFLDTRSFLRVGGERSISVDTRIIAATNRDLPVCVDRGEFRLDLFHRLNVLPIELPPLRERTEDLPELVEALLSRLTSEMGLAREVEVSEDVMVALALHDWPGNIRDLRNVLERALILADGGRIEKKHLRLANRTNGSFAPNREEVATVAFPEDGVDLHETVRDVSRKLVRAALRRGKTREQTAQLLGLSRYALNHQMKKLGLMSSNPAD